MILNFVNVKTTKINFFQSIFLSFKYFFLGGGAQNNDFPLIEYSFNEISSETPVGRADVIVGAEPARDKYFTRDRFRPPGCDASGQTHSGPLVERAHSCVSRECAAANGSAVDARGVWWRRGWFPFRFSARTRGIFNPRRARNNYSIYFRFPTENIIIIIYLLIHPASPEEPNNFPQRRERIEDKNEIQHV